MMKNSNKTKVILLLLFLTQVMSGQNQTITEQVLDTIPYIIVDKEPEFPGGNDSLRKFIGRNLRYPDILRDDLDGTVWIKFIVDENGAISGAKIEKGLSEYYDNEVLRIIRSMPNWTPGIKNNKKVRTIKYMPIKISLR